MKVLIIVEDRTHDQYIVKPIIERIFLELEKRASVDVLVEPHLRGATQALDESTINEIIRDNAMVDLFVLIVDRDCDREGNSTRAAQRQAEHPGKLVSCLAVQEVEVWMLAVQDQFDKPWGQVRVECDPKEIFAAPYLKARGWQSQLGGGYKRAMSELRGKWSRLVKLCPEVQDLMEAIRKTTP